MKHKGNPQTAFPSHRGEVFKKRKSCCCGEFFHRRIWVNGSEFRPGTHGCCGEVAIMARFFKRGFEWMNQKSGQEHMAVVERWPLWRGGHYLTFNISDKETNRSTRANLHSFSVYKYQYSFWTCCISYLHNVFRFSGLRGRLLFPEVVQGEQRFCILLHVQLQTVKCLHPLHLYLSEVAYC